MRYRRKILYIFKSKKLCSSKVCHIYENSRRMMSITSDNLLDYAIIYDMNEISFEGDINIEVRD